jgi:hypothetical protein
MRSRAAKRRGAVCVCHPPTFCKKLLVCACRFVLKGEFQRANIMRTKLLGGLEGKLLINQVVGAIEASPEKAGGGGSSPSLATIFIIRLLLQSPMQALHLVVAAHKRLNQRRCFSIESMR